MFEIILGLSFILLCEYIADFILQSREIATKKSTSFKHLIQHLLIINGALGLSSFIVFYLILGNPLLSIFSAAFFAIINTIIHGIVDWNIWKGYKVLVWYRERKRIYKEQREKYNGMLGSESSTLFFEAQKAWVTEKKYAEDPWFYNTIGLDRYLHIITIIFTYFWVLGFFHI